MDSRKSQADLNSDSHELRPVRRSQLDMNNELVNKEMKTLFKQVTNQTNDITTITNDINNDFNETNNNTVTLNIVHGSSSNKTMSATADDRVKASQSSSINNANITNNKQSFIDLAQNKSNKPGDNINFNNAIFNKNFVQMQPQAAHNESVNDTDMTVFSNNITTSDANLNDDLSLLPVIDEKTVLTSIKAKFEMRKYYVSLNFC